MEVCWGSWGSVLQRSRRKVRRYAAVSLLAVALLLVPAVLSHAWNRGGPWHPGFRGHGVIVVGPSFWWGPSYPYWWDYPPPYYVYAPPPVDVQEPPVYVQPPAPPQAYWYYCPSVRAYYPTAPTCSEAWVKVPPRPE